MVKGSGRLASSSTRMSSGLAPLSTGHVDRADGSGLDFPAAERAGHHPAQNIGDQQRRRQFIFHRAAAGMESDHAPVSARSRARRSPGLRRSRRPRCLPAAGENISADSSVTSRVRRPAPKAVSGCQRSSFTSGLRGPHRNRRSRRQAAQSRSTRCAGAAGGAKRSSTTTSAFTAGSYFAGDSNIGIHLRIGWKSAGAATRVRWNRPLRARKLPRAVRSRHDRPAEMRRER